MSRRASNLVRTCLLESLENRNLMAVDIDDSISEAVPMALVGSLPTTVSDSISVSTDVDMRRIVVRAGQTVDFDIDTSNNGPGGLGSYLRLFDSAGRQLAANNDAAAPGEDRIGFDSFLRYTFASSGTYFIGVSNYSNTWYSAITGDGDAASSTHATGAYRLTARILPVDQDDALNEARSLGVIGRTVVDGYIDNDLDVNMYHFRAVAGQVIDFDIDTSLNGPGGLGSYLRIFDATGRELAYNNDAAAPGETRVGFDAYLRYRFSSAGTYYVGVSTWSNTAYNPVTGGGDRPSWQHAVGSYVLTVSNVSSTPAPLPTPPRVTPPWWMIAQAGSTADSQAAKPQSSSTQQPVNIQAPASVLGWKSESSTAVDRLMSDLVEHDLDVLEPALWA